MSAQDALWSIPEALGWIWYATLSLMAAAAALIMILKMILHHPFDALLVARFWVVGGLICFAYRVFNSGLSEIGIAFIVTGSLFTSLIMASGWCNRPEPRQMLVPYLWCRTVCLIYKRKKRVQV